MRNDKKIIVSKSLTSMRTETKIEIEKAKEGSPV
jgi:hypothetical protein